MPDLDFFGKEKRGYDRFKREHMCSDGKFEFEVTVSYSFTTGIGRNSFVKCERCGAQQEITDYTVW